MESVLCCAVVTVNGMHRLESKFAEDGGVLLKLPEPFGTMSHCMHNFCIDLQVIAFPYDFTASPDVS